MVLRAPELSMALLGTIVCENEYMNIFYEHLVRSCRVLDFLTKAYKT